MKIKWITSHRILKAPLQYLVDSLLIFRLYQQWLIVTIIKAEQVTSCDSAQHIHLVTRSLLSVVSSIGPLTVTCQTYLYQLDWRNRFSNLVTCRKQLIIWIGIIYSSPNYRWELSWTLHLDHSETPYKGGAPSIRHDKRESFQFVISLTRNSSIAKTQANRPSINMNVFKVIIIFAALVSLVELPGALCGPIAYGICQAGCAGVVVACFAAAGVTFGTVPGAVIAATPALATCNSAYAACYAACSAAFLLPTP